MIVVDASLMIAWLFQEPELAAANDVFDALEHETLLVPSHWPVEIANALWVNARRGRVPLERLDTIVDQLSIFDIAIDPPLLADEVGALARFAVAEGLTAYDATYLRLAVLLNVPLATLDNAVRAAARRLNVLLLPA